MKQYQKILFCAVFAAVLCLYQGAAQSVDEPEIRTTGSQDVVFQNYNGPHAVINTAAEITNIGVGLGSSVRETAGSAGASDRYQILHIIDPSDPQGFDADILVLGNNAGVDHIRNLRRIIAGYLSAAYGYSSDDASTLAVFVTVYNAVYRTRLDYFASKYKSAVMRNLTQEKVGLSLNYSDWPGGTQIVIPISDPQGGLSSVDTSAISDKTVIESFQGEDDKGIDDRKQMVDIKEREADQLQTVADKAQEQQKVEEQKLEEVRAQAATARENANQARQEADRNPDDPAAVKKAEDAELIASQKEVQADEQERVAQEQTQKAEDAQAAADTKRDEAMDERQAIAADQGTLIAQGQDALAQAAGVYGLKLLDAAGLLSSVVRVSSQNGQTLKESPVRVVRSRTIYPVSDGLIAIAGENKRNGAVKLVVLDFDNIEILRESEEIVAENSVIAVDGANNYYAVIQDGSKWVLGKYNDQLQMQQKSALAVNPATPVVFTTAGIIVTGADGTPKLLKLADLTEIK